jgi:hypothetical protein
MEYPTPKCPECDAELSQIWIEKDDTWDYDEDHGNYSERYGDEIRVKCPHCEKDITEHIGNPNDFNMHDEVTDKNGVQRRCEYCEDFIPDDDKSDPEYREELDGHCNKDGSMDEVADMTEPLTKQDCNAFRLCKLLKEQVDSLWLSDVGVIQEAQQQ